MKKLIINADDFGLTDGVSKAIVQLLEADAISNTSMMITIEGASDRYQKFINKDISPYVGVHLTTTPENYHRKPLSNPSAIPTLVNDDGLFKELDNADWVNPNEIELEWEAQILKTCDVLSHSPSHLDSHHGIHREESLTPTYLKLAKKYNVPVRGGRNYGQIDGTSISVPSTSLCSVNWTGKNKTLEDLKISILKSFENLPIDAVLEICTHPGFCDDELIKSSSWNICRENDFQCLLKLSQSSWLQDNDIKLIRFNDL